MLDVHALSEHGFATSRRGAVSSVGQLLTWTIACLRPRETLQAIFADSLIVRWHTGALQGVVLKLVRSNGPCRPNCLQPVRSTDWNLLVERFGVTSAPYSSLVSVDAYACVSARLCALQAGFVSPVHLSGRCRKTVRKPRASCAPMPAILAQWQWLRLVSYIQSSGRRASVLGMSACRSTQPGVSNCVNSAPALECVKTQSQRGAGLWSSGRLAAALCLALLGLVTAGPTAAASNVQAGCPAQCRQVCRSDPHSRSAAAGVHLRPLSACMPQRGFVASLSLTVPAA